MGYCDSGCEYLTTRHKCNKYHKGLTYSSFSSKSLAYSSHERCSECDKDHWIKKLEGKIKESDKRLTELLNNADDSSDYRESIVEILSCLDFCK